MLFDGIVPWIVADAAESQLAPGQSLERLQGDLASWEMETRDLTYPNARYQSHDWIVGTTKIVLHHGCPKPGKPTASQPTTHIWYEKRMEFEPWNR